jgi:hypothetical protein
MRGVVDHVPGPKDTILGGGDGLLESNRRPAVHGLGDVRHALDRLDLEIRSDQMVRYPEIELIGPSEVINLAIVVPLTSLVSHLDALWLGESGPVNGELIVAAGLEVHVCPLSSESLSSICHPGDCRAAFQ